MTCVEKNWLASETAEGQSYALTYLSTINRFRPQSHGATSSGLKVVLIEKNSREYKLWLPSKINYYHPSGTRDCHQSLTVTPRRGHVGPGQDKILCSQKDMLVLRQIWARLVWGTLFW